MIAFRCNFISCTIFSAVVSFLDSCYVNLFHWFSVSSMCNTICLFEHKNQVYIGKIFIAYNPVVKTMADLFGLFIITHLFSILRSITTGHIIL